MVSVRVSAQVAVEPAEVRGAEQRLRRLKAVGEAVQDRLWVRGLGFPETEVAQVAARVGLPREESAELVSGRVAWESVRRPEVARVSDPVEVVEESARS